MTDSASVFARCPSCGNALLEPLGSLGRDGPTCPGCGRAALAPAHPFSGVYEVVEYDFDDVTPSERAEAADLLVGAQVPYRWEEGYRLLVPPDREDEVDVLFGHIPPHAALPANTRADPRDSVAALADRDEQAKEPADWAADEEPADWAADEESAEALATLFDAADRLLHHPDNEDAAAELADATGVMMVAPVPFGVNDVLWRTVGQLARQIVGLLDEGAASADVAAAAEALRAVLRDHV